jgi:uncharacterized repeat protein (TIGR03803 family)
MKMCIKNPFLIALLTTCLGSILAGRLTAQTLTTLHSFAPQDLNTYANEDGALPLAGLVLLGNSLFGTTGSGSASANGTVFTINSDGTGFSDLYSFTVGTLGIGNFPIFNSDGAHPQAALILSSNILFGTANGGGVSDNGTVFAINSNGTGFRTLHNFTATDTDVLHGGTNSDGARPAASLILLGNSLYGTTSLGGSSGQGVVFSLQTDGTGFRVLHNFSGSDGANPGSLIVSSSTLYGTTGSGGSSASGTVFKISADGTGFNSLYSFTGGDDGAGPRGLLLSGATLYGTAGSGGSSGKGTLFGMNTDGTGFAALHSFGGIDGAIPKAGLVSLGNTLYGSSASGGLDNRGTIFAINTDGTGFTNLYSFTGGDDGLNPNVLILSNNIFYGTTQNGGTSESGTVFSLSLPSIISPQLTITPSGGNVLLAWPTNVLGFNLQSTTNLVSPAVWAVVSPDPVVVNGQYTVTNPIVGTQQFYRLSQ